MVLRRIQPSLKKPTKVLEAESRAALLKVRDESEAIRVLYELWKKTDPKYSLAYFCERAGMPSKGYLSDIIHGRRSLNAKYRVGISKAFQLTGETAQCFKLLVEISHEKDDEKRVALRTKLALLRKALNIKHQPITARLYGIFFALEVFCAFGLFRNSPSYSQLVSYFGVDREFDILNALQLLTAMKLVEAGEDSAYRLLTEHFVMGESEEDLSHVDFIKLALTHAAESVELWFPQKNQAVFVSSVLSVRLEQYEKIISELKAKLLLTQAELESGQADTLVRFNVQIYPIGLNPIRE